MGWICLSCSSTRAQPQPWSSVPARRAQGEDGGVLLKQGWHPWGFISTLRLIPQLPRPASIAADSPFPDTTSSSKLAPGAEPSSRRWGLWQEEVSGRILHPPHKPQNSSLGGEEDSWLECDPTLGQFHGQHPLAGSRTPMSPALSVPCRCHGAGRGRAAAAAAGAEPSAGVRG